LSHIGGSKDEKKMIINKYPPARQYIKVKLNVIIQGQYCLLCSAKVCAIEEGRGDKPVAGLGFLSDKCSGRTEQVYTD
jgi:hypothetical protein